MLGCKPADTPMESNYKIGYKGNSPLVDAERYQLLVEKLIYLFHTRHRLSCYCCRSIYEQA